jgi:hypothetical protein
LKNLDEVELLLSKNPVDKDSITGFFEMLSKKSDVAKLKVNMKDVLLYIIRSATWTMIS